MSHPQSKWSHAPAPQLLLAGALLTTGCIADLPGSAAVPAVPAGTSQTGGLWDLAPVDAVEGVVLRDGALARALALMADPDCSPTRIAFEAWIQDRSRLPFDPLSPEAWVGAGLDPRKGAALFAFADRKRGMLLVLPVSDRALFRHAFGIRMHRVEGRDIDELDDEMQCEPVAGRYLCAHDLQSIAAAAAPHASALATTVTDLDERGEVELSVTRDAPGIERFNHEKSSPGWMTAVTGTLRLRDDGATLRIRANGSLATPAARGYYAARPPADLLEAARGAPTVARLHVDPAAIFPPSSDLDKEVRTELVEQLAGDAEVIPSGSGFAGATMILPVTDAARVEAFVKKRCAREAAAKERRPLGGFTVQDHGCAAVFDTRRLFIPLGFPEVPVIATVTGGRLVITMGSPAAEDAKGPPGALPVEAIEGEAAKRALEGAETLLFFAHDLGIGPEVKAGDLFRGAMPVFGERIAKAVEAWDYASAHLSQAFVRASVTDDGADVTLDLTSFAADPAPAREAYAAALTRRFAGDDAGYREALAAIERRFPGTRAAWRAAEVRRGAPYFGAGIGLLATLAALGSGDTKGK